MAYIALKFNIQLSGLTFNSDGPGQLICKLRCQNHLNSISVSYGKNSMNGKNLNLLPSFFSQDKCDLINGLSIFNQPDILFDR